MNQLQIHKALLLEKLHEDSENVALLLELGKTELEISKTKRDEIRNTKNFLEED